MLSNIELSNIMSTDLITVHPEECMDKVKQLFETNDIHHILVIDEDQKLEGIIGVENLKILSHHLTLYNTKRQESFNETFLKTVRAEEVMTKQVATLRPTDRVGVAAGIFRENRFHALPIVADTKVVGIVTTFDLLNYAYREPNLANVLKV